MLGQESGDAVYYLPKAQTSNSDSELGSQEAASSLTRQDPGLAARRFIKNFLDRRGLKGLFFAVPKIGTV